MTGRQWLMTRLPAGVSLRLHAYKARYITEPELSWALTKVNRGDLVVDVGSSFGVYTFWLAKRVGVRGSVVALDPTEPCARFLQTAVSQLGLTQVKVIQCGASDSATTRELHIPIEGNHERMTRATFRRVSGVAEVVKVVVRPLDDLLSTRDRPVSFIKCDVEGHELAVLRGTRAILAADRPTLLVECEQRHLDYDMQHTFNYLYNLGYEGWFLDGLGITRSLREFSQAVHQISYLDDTTSANYVNNFLFLHPHRSLLAASWSARGH